MREDYEQLFSHLEPALPPAGLFERVVSAIRQEQELRRKRKLFFASFIFLFIAIFAAPFSWIYMAGQAADSGVVYFLSAAAGNLGIFAQYWKDFCMAILDSLPLGGLTVCVVNLGLALFAFNLLILWKKAKRTTSGHGGLAL